MDLFFIFLVLAQNWNENLALKKKKKGTNHSRLHFFTYLIVNWKCKEQNDTQILANSGDAVDCTFFFWTWTAVRRHGGKEHCVRVQGQFLQSEREVRAMQEVSVCLRRRSLFFPSRPRLLWGNGFAEPKLFPAAAVGGEKRSNCILNLVTHIFDESSVHLEALIRYFNCVMWFYS